jgi:hypothetical protein
MTATELHELLYYEDGKLFWKKDVARNVKAGQEAGTNFELHTKDFEFAEFVAQEARQFYHGAFANRGVSL